MSKNLQLFTVKEIRDDQTEADVVEKLVGSDLLNIRSKILTAITNDDIKEFDNLLHELFIYPLKVGKSVVKNSIVDGHGVTTTQEPHYVRPLIEELILDRQNHLLEIVTALLEKDNAAWYLVFIKDLERVTSVDDLFNWNRRKQRAIEGQLSLLEEHAEKISGSESGKKKAAVIKDVVRTISQAMLGDTNPLNVRTHDESDDKVSDKAKFENLRFKLTLSRTINENADSFAQHRSYKRLLTNILTILFGGIANLVNKLVTGNWLFFNKTTTQQLAEKVEETLGTHPKLVGG